MNSWTKVRRALGGSDPRHWRVPGFLELQLRGDYWRRFGFAVGMGLGISGPLAALLLAVAPPEEVGKAALLSLLLVVTVTAIAFLAKDTVQIIVSLEDDSLRRRIKPMLVNPLGWRDRDESWAYNSMRGCGVVPLDQLNGKFSVIVIPVPDQILTLIVPRRVDVKQVASFLAKQGLQVKGIREIPSQARPQPSVSRRNMITAWVVAGVGLLLTATGGIARLAIHGEGRKMDSTAVAAMVQAAPEGTAVRECVGLGRSGVDQAKISPDGRWVWALGTVAQAKHLLWNDEQEKPIGELEMPKGYSNHALFTPDSGRLVVVADLDVHVWQLEPLEQQGQFQLEATPNDVTVTADGNQLIVSAMSATRLYDLTTGQPDEAMPITLGAIVDTCLSADGNRLIVAQHPRILGVSLDDGVVEELIRYQSPNRAHLSGKLAPGGRWAAMQSKQGTVLYDLAKGKQASIIAAGPMSAKPVITSDGTRLALSTRHGVGVWDTATKKPLVCFPFSSSTKLDLSDNGRYLLGYASRKTKLAVWEMP